MTGVALGTCILGLQGLTFGHPAIDVVTGHRVALVDGSRPRRMHVGELGQPGQPRTQVLTEPPVGSGHTG